MQSLSLKLRQIAGRLDKPYRHFRGKGINYWLVVATLVPLGLLAGDIISEHKILIGPRFRIYQILQNTSVRSPHSYDYTRLVGIGDEEFWKGELARRSPLKRKYLAKLIRKLAKGEPKVIALDIDLRSQTLDKSVVDHSDYREETLDLVQAICEVSDNTKVVLAQTLISEPFTEEPILLTETKKYKEEPTILDDFPFDSNQVLKGYVSLPYDIRQVPLTLTLQDGRPLKSFAEAIAQVLGPDAVNEAKAKQNDALPYGTFIATMDSSQLSARHVLESTAKELTSQVGGKAVLIGEVWHQRAGRGEQVDMHVTPLGEIGGMLIHANYVEALLQHWTSRPLGKKLTVAIEIFLSVAIAIVFAWDMQPGKKILAALAMSLILIIVTYFFWQNLGLFFDFSIPLILLGSHVVFERIRDWRREAKMYRQHAKTCAELEVQDA